MRIESVSAQPDRVGRYLILLEDGVKMRLYRQTVEDFGLYAGLELDDAQMRALRTAAEKMSARMRAVRIISASSVSKGDLEQRLIHKGEQPQQAQEAVRWLSDMSLLDDRETARQIVSRCAAKGYGAQRAKQALYEKRIPKEYWQEVLDDYPDQTEKITAFLQSRLGNSRERRDIQRATDALLRRGHSYSQIRQALNALAPDEDFPEE